MKKIISYFILSILLTASVFAKGKKEKFTYVQLKTTKGIMVVQLYNETPKHRDNFIKIVKSKQYDSLLFHRVIKDFMIQGGDPNSKNATPGQMLGDGEIKGVERIPAEFNSKYYHKKGALAAARDGNAEKASSNCQFYIVQGKLWTDSELDRQQVRSGMNYTPEQRNIYKTIGGTPFLDNNYTVYGELVLGFDVLDNIATTKTAASDRPEEDVMIIEAKILKKFNPNKKVKASTAKASKAGAEK